MALRAALAWPPARPGQDARPAPGQEQRPVEERDPVSGGVTVERERVMHYYDHLHAHERRVEEFWRPGAARGEFEAARRRRVARDARIALLDDQVPPEARVVIALGRLRQIIARAWQESCAWSAGGVSADWYERAARGLGLLLPPSRGRYERPEETARSSTSPGRATARPTRASTTTSPGRSTPPPP